MGKNENGTAREARLGIVGFGARAETLLVSLFAGEGLAVGAVCDRSEKALERGSAFFRRHDRPPPPEYGDHHAMLAGEDLDAVIVTTSWNSHLAIAMDVMLAGKPVAIEVGGASSTEELWQLVHASERTGASCMMLENCCYGRNELMVLNMARQGLFGELVHCAGGYEHDLREEIVLGLERGIERGIHNLYRNGDLYPTHQLGPIAKILKINRGNRFLSLTSTASKSRGNQAYAAAHYGRGTPRGEVGFNKGDVVTTVIRCAGGETITLTHSVSLPRPYSRNGRVQGTRGIWSEDTGGIYIEGTSPSVEEIDPAGHPYTTHQWEPVERFYPEYDHPIWKDYHGHIVGGHEGKDWLALQAFVDAVRRGVPTPIDVYDCAAWMSVTCLSEQSVALGGMPVAFPDFTSGKWIRRGPAPPGKWSLDD